MSKKQRDAYVPSPGFILRTPLLPYRVWLDFSQALEAPQADPAKLHEALRRDSEQLRERLRAIVLRPDVREALFIASPSLHESLDYWIDAPDSPRGQKVERSLVRYLSRLTGRATPFGLFAGVSAGRIGKTTHLRLTSRKHYSRHTRFDNDYLFALAEDLARDPALREALRYFPNDSLYTAAGRLRYARADAGSKARAYHLVAVEPTEYLAITLERAVGGARRTELAEVLVASDPEIERDEALSFIDELIDHQVLVVELKPQVTGDEPIHGMLAILQSVPSARRTANLLATAQGAIDSLDADSLGADPTTYREITGMLEELPTAIVQSQAFQVDLVKPALDATLGERVLAEINRGIEVLASISPRGRDPLRQFRDAFIARYGAREVPLVDALDAEIGIGFEESGAPDAEASPLLAGLEFPRPPHDNPRVDWSPRVVHLMSRLHGALARSERAIELGPDDLKALLAHDPVKLPESFACMPEILARSHEAVAAGEFRVILGSSGGPSGARLSGRFCHASKAINQGVLEHIRAEEELRPEAIFAEIVHLPEGRIGNVLFRPLLRKYEIAYLGLSGAPRDRRISIQDLNISVRLGRLTLRSRRLDREVIPRLTSAHNYSLRSLGIYRFLCSLQSQGVGGFRFSWGPLKDAPFLPRVNYGRLIFSRARWRLGRDDLKLLADARKGAGSAMKSAEVAALRQRVYEAVQSLRGRRDLPRRVVLADGDNELPLDLDNVIVADSFAQLVKNRSGVTLYEELPTADDLLVEGPEGRFVHQLYVSFVRRTPKEARQNISGQMGGHRMAGEGARSHPAIWSLPPGSEWLYAKLYTGTATADEVLRLVVGPVVREAKELGLIDRWFFIRFGDPDWHLRVRFHGEANRLQASVAPLLSRATAKLIEKGMVWKLAFDTYDREVERYGGPRGIELAEALFCTDSEAVAGIVELFAGQERMEARWRLAVRGTDMLLDDLGLTFEEKRALIRRARASMGREFHVNATLGRQIGARWKLERKALSTILARDPTVNAEHDYQPGFALLDARSRSIAPILAELRRCEAAGELTTPITEIAWGLIHMHNNRVLRSAARAQELVIYDFLNRYYSERWARANEEALQ